MIYILNNYIYIYIIIRHILLYFRYMSKSSTQCLRDFYKRKKQDSEEFRQFLIDTIYINIYIFF